MVSFSLAFLYINFFSCVFSFIPQSTPSPFVDKKRILIIRHSQKSPIEGDRKDMEISNMDKSSTDDIDLKELFKIRTITGFVSLTPEDFDESNNNLEEKIQKRVEVISGVKARLEKEGYEIQTTRLTTNNFGQYLYKEKKDDDEENSEKILSTADKRLSMLDSVLEKYDIGFCSLGSAQSQKEIRLFSKKIIFSSNRFSTTANIKAGDVQSSKLAATCIKEISQKDMFGNFRFGTVSYCKSGIPFFPASNHDERDEGFAIGLENGRLANYLLNKCKSIENIDVVFREGMIKALLPVQKLCVQESDFMGIDTSLNPSLDEDGSVAKAMECIQEISGGVFGNRGTLSVSAAITRVLQSLDCGGDQSIKSIGYCGLMLPVCEDLRLSELASSKKPVTITDLLNISSVCGVGIDTVPLAEDVTKEELVSLLLDVAGLAGRWNKSLSCRVFPHPERKAGEMTLFDESPYLCNCHVFSID